MKTKYILPLLFVTFGITNVNSFATTDSYCHFEGITQQKQDQEKEFSQLLEPQNSFKFSTISSIIGIIALTSSKDLKDPSCEISEYTKKLVRFYKKNKEEIKNNNQDLGNLLENIQKELETK